MKKMKRFEVQFDDGSRYYTIDNARHEQHAIDQAIDLYRQCYNKIPKFHDVIYLGPAFTQRACRRNTSYED